MKNIALLLSIFIFSISFNSYCSEKDSIINSTELAAENTSDSTIADSLANDSTESSEETPSQPAGYGQLFMFGFLVLGAILVVWKFKGYQ